MIHRCEADRAGNDDGVRRLHRLPGVTSTALGLKMVAGRFTDEPALVVYVRRKRPRSQVRVGECIPESVGGWPTDVQEELRSELFAASQSTETVDRTHVRPLRSGIAIAVTSDGSGTLGFFATHLASDQAVLVSNYHVLYRDRGFLIPQDPHPVYQPAEGPSRKVADMSGSLGDGEIGGELDCAFATLITETSCFCCRSTIPHANKVDARKLVGANHAEVGQVVTKTGIATGQTTGKIVSVDKDVTGTIDYSPYNLPAGSSFSFENLIMVVTWDPDTEEFKPEEPFASGGDSGAVLVNENDEVVGLHQASYHNPDNGRRYAFACHIDKVESALGVRIPGERYGAGPPVTESAELAALDDPIDAAAGEFAIAGTPQDDDLPLAWGRLRATLARSAAGRRWLELLQQHRFEVLQLINHCRPVTLRWHRLHGPAYAAAVARSARVSEYRIPDEVEGVTPGSLIDGMLSVLGGHASDRLREDLEAVRPAVTAAVRDHRTALELMEGLAAVVPEQEQRP